MRLRDYFHSDSPVYRHLSSEKRNRRVTELWVAAGFGLFSTVTVLLVFLVKALYDHQYLFQALPE